MIPGRRVWACFALVVVCGSLAYVVEAAGWNAWVIFPFTVASGALFGNQAVLWFMRRGETW